MAEIYNFPELGGEEFGLSQEIKYEFAVSLKVQLL